MRLSWKIFFSTLLIIVITFAVGGYVLISSLFHSALDRERSSATDEITMLRFYLETADDAIPSGNDNLLLELTKSTAQQMNHDKKKIRLYDHQRRLIYESDKVDYALSLFSNITEDTVVQTVITDDERYMIQSLSMIGEGQYLESFRDITSVFLDRQSQFVIYQRLMILMILLNCILIYIVSKWITHPLIALSKATRKIATGDYSSRAGVKSKDEIGLLAEAFNAMADVVEHKIFDLQEINARQQDFIGSFAHEIKTPLTSIIGYADMLRSSKMTDEEQFLAANYIWSEGHRLESLSFKLLELIVLQKRDFPMRKVLIDQLIDDSLALMAPITAKITMSVILENAMILGEGDLLKTLIINLMDNARKSGADAITVTGKRAGTAYKITISDNGKGIPKEEIKRITEAFYMVDKSRYKTDGGAGLGLAICREIVKLHKGQMHFTSEVGAGTTVCVTLGIDDGKENVKWDGAL